MTVTYNWTFPSFTTARLENDLSDVVKIIHWRLWGGDGTFGAETYGTTTLGAPDPANFIELSEITEDWAINRVEASVDLVALKANLASQLEAQHNPPTVTGPPPFNKSTEELPKLPTLTIKDIYNGKI